MQLPHILLIEDNKGITDALQAALRESYALDVAHTGKFGIYRADRERYDAIVLDLGLPDIDGLAVCQQLRERGVQLPILVLTAEASVLTKITLLDAGANDYLSKPFSLGELKARLRVLCRSSQQAWPIVPQKLEVGDARLCISSREVTRSGRQILLRRKEFRLLECLMTHAGSVVSREMLTRYAWEGSDAPWTNTIDVHIKYLRDKFDRPFDTPMITTVHGIGYKLQASPRPVELVKS